MFKVLIMTTFFQESISSIMAEFESIQEAERTITILSNSRYPQGIVVTYIPLY
jgi:hypothetical protein